MTRKLTATFFNYTIRNEYGETRELTGSYLGRKSASVNTIRRFVAANQEGSPFKLASFTVTSSGETQWIAK